MKDMKLIVVCFVCVYVCVCVCGVWCVRACVVRACVRACVGLGWIVCACARACVRVFCLYMCNCLSKMKIFNRKFRSVCRRKANRNKVALPSLTMICYVSGICVTHSHT